MFIYVFILAVEVDDSFGFASLCICLEVLISFRSVFPVRCFRFWRTSPVCAGRLIYRSLRSLSSWLMLVFHSRISHVLCSVFRFLSFLSAFFSVFSFLFFRSDASFRNSFFSFSRTTRNLISSIFGTVLSVICQMGGSWGMRADNSNYARQPIQSVLRGCRHNF